MKTTIVLASLAFAASAQAADIRIPRPSLMNLDHKFAELSGPGVELKGCTADHHPITVQGAIFVDQTAMVKKHNPHLPVDRLRAGLQSAFTASMKTIKDADYNAELLTTTGFAEADKAITDYQYKMKGETGVPMVMIQRATALNTEESCTP